MFLQKKFEQNMDSVIAQKNLVDWQKKIDKEPSFNFIKKLYQTFPKAEVYLVGGAVRDIILKRQNKDYDFVVRNISAEKLQPFLEQRGKLILVGKTFGVFKFIPTGFDLKHAFDIALPRTDQSWGTGGYRDVDIQSSPNLAIDKDLSRRDFTINALVWECRQQQLVDPFQGLKDIQNKVIRTVGKPKERFAEDYSRMLRGLRFASQLDFEIEQTTWQAIKKNIKHLNDKKENGERIVPEEIISRELLKSLIADPIKTIDLFDQSGAWLEIIPELLQMKGCPQPSNWHSEGDVWIHTKLVVEKLYSKKFKQEFGEQPPSIELIIACLFHDIAKPLTIKTPEKDGTNRIRFDGHTNEGAKLFLEICQRLKLTAVEEFKINPEKVAWLIKNHLLLLQGNIEQMKATTIEKYFFNQQRPGKELLKLTFVDALGTIPQSGKSDLSTFYQMKERISKLKKLIEKRERLPHSLLNGQEIMGALKLKSGPQVGKLLTVLREEQLTGRIKNKKVAMDFLKELTKKQG